MTKKVRPIKPSEVTGAKKISFPDAVLESFNEIIAQNFSGNSATFKQNDVIALMVKKGLKHEEIFAKKWLYVEEVYGAEGWDVSYDSPAYNESYPSTFTFKRQQTK